MCRHLGKVQPRAGDAWRKETTFAMVRCCDWGIATGGAVWPGYFSHPCLPENVLIKPGVRGKDCCVSGPSGGWIPGTDPMGTWEETNLKPHFD